MEEVKIVIIGAGVVGLAVACELSEHYEDIIVLERHGSFGQEISSRNSEVMHAGIYYPKDSLKARLCVEGLDLLYDACEKYSIPHKKLGKLIVATDEKEAEALIDVYDKGIKNGVRDLRLIEEDEIKRIEPNVKAVKAIHSPNTGIIDTHSLMKNLYDRAEANGAMVAFNSEVIAIDKDNDSYVLSIKQDDYRLKSRLVINSAGLSSDSVAHLAGVDIDGADYGLKYCKGSYFSYSKRSPVGMLVYPVPEKKLTGLGIHATLDLGGRLRFGPDTEYIDAIDYNVDPAKLDKFYEGAVKFIPSLDKDAFMPDMAGVRPKLYGKGEDVRDFVITDESEKGLPGLIDLVGIESPGITASLAIAKEVKRIISSKGYID